MPDTILILEPLNYNPDAVKVYSRLGTVRDVDNGVDSIKDKRTVDTLVCRLGYHLNDNFLGMFPNLKFIVSPTTGLNHIDQTYCENNDISIISLKGEADFLDSIRSTSEHTISLILSLVRNIVPSVNSVVRGNQWDRERFKGRELSSLSIGILGVGRIGKHIIDYARAFNMSVFACDPYKSLGYLKDQNVTVCSKDELFTRSDIVTVHVDYCSENIGMITLREFNLMKPGSYFVNTSRGELVDEDDLIKSMDSGVLKGAALDVVSNEQNLDGLFDKRIMQYAKDNPNLIITPHIGGCTSDAMWNTELFVARKFENTIRK